MWVFQFLRRQSLARQNNLIRKDWAKTHDKNVKCWGLNQAQKGSVCVSKKFYRHSKNRNSQIGETSKSLIIQANMQRSIWSPKNQTVQSAFPSGRTASIWRGDGENRITLPPQIVLAELTGVWVMWPYTGEIGPLIFKSWASPVFSHLF